MSCSSEREWLEQRIARTREQIIAIDDAIVALEGGMFSYSLDTGQSRQTVTRHNLASLKETLLALENRLATLQARLCGAGVRVIPSW